MVKGNTRQVIVVKSPDTRLFEQAIFLLKEDAIEKSGVTARDLMEEARIAADNYMTQQAPPCQKHHIPSIIWAMIGAACVGFIWLTSSLLL